MEAKPSAKYQNWQRAIEAGDSLEAGLHLMADASEENNVYKLGKALHEAIAMVALYEEEVVAQNRSHREKDKRIANLTSVIEPLTEAVKKLTKDKANAVIARNEAFEERDIMGDRLATLAKALVEAKAHHVGLSRDLDQYKATATRLSGESRAKDAEIADLKRRLNKLIMGP
jgi:chromosome segregation ATPase